MHRNEPSLKDAHVGGVALASVQRHLASLDCAPYGAPLGMTLGGTVLAAVEIRI
jgi:hypothetical protein